MKLDVLLGRKVRVGLAMFERMTNGQYPWVQNSQIPGKMRRYGLCPECSNPMLLVNIGNPNPAQKPHGRHQLKPVEGFEFALEKILGCGLFDPSGVTQLAHENDELDLDACERRAFLVDNFNLAIGILQEDIGIEISCNMATKILEIYFEEHWYRWKTASLGSLPWLFGRTAVAYNLYGQTMRPTSDVAHTILNAIPDAELGPYNRLAAKPGKRIALEFGLRNHVVRYAAKGRRAESVDFFVVGKGGGNDQQNELVFEKTIHLRSDEFLERVANKRPPTGYGAQLVQTAQKALARYLERHPEAKNPDTELSND